MDPVLSDPVKTLVNAAKITRQSKSNLALAFISLGRERKRDITIFYAFCRVIDDIADSSELSVAEKRVRLEAWRKMLRTADAVEVGLALQMTNIIRDVGRDLRYGRIYLPQEDLARLNYSEAELQDRQYNERFVRLMEFEATRAQEFFSLAAAALPSED